MFSTESQHLQAWYRELNDTAVNYPRDTTIGALFEEQVQRMPDATAVVLGDSSLTYGELNLLSGKLAYRLLQDGIKRGDIIGILAERSLEMIIALYAALKVGAAYIPLAPDFPDQRIHYMLKESAAACIITQPQFAGRVKTITSIAVDLHDERLHNAPEYKPKYEGRSQDVMYVIFTSGSTGNPKGVMVENRSVVNRLLWMQKQYPITEKDALLQKTPFVFDVSVWELFWWSITGAALVLLQPGGEKLPQFILHAVQRHQVTMLHFVPSMLNSFMNYAESPEDLRQLNSLKRVFCSGEALTAAHVAKFNTTVGKHTGATLTNLYGPTETTVDVTYYDCPKNQEPLSIVPIGKPIDNTKVYILDGDTLLPPGQKGELCISGDGLARGYINQPALTCSKFTVNPISKGEKIYRTGDYARLLPDGNIEYLGRMDNQVKIRGIRIELGEIEAKICEHEAVAQCVVLVKDKDKINPLITAYVLTDNQNLTSDALIKFLKLLIPAYMIPNKFYMLNSFPVTANGKADRKALSSMHEIEPAQ